MADGTPTTSQADTAPIAELDPVDACQKVENNISKTLKDWPDKPGNFTFGSIKGTLEECVGRLVAAREALK